MVVRVDILHDFYIPALQRSVHYDRVAGYFRSTSLAAASQGFSALVGRQGQMRLIVGADLDPDDVRAILHGSEERLAARLNAELDGAAAWPEGVRHGVELLAWMVAHGSSGGAGGLSGPSGHRRAPGGGCPGQMATCI